MPPPFQPVPTKKRKHSPLPWRGAYHGFARVARPHERPRPSRGTTPRGPSRSHVLRRRPNVASRATPSSAGRPSPPQPTRSSRHLAPPTSPVSARLTCISLPPPPPPSDRLRQATPAQTPLLGEDGEEQSVPGAAACSARASYSRGPSDSSREATAWPRGSSRRAARAPFCASATPTRS